MTTNKTTWSEANKRCLMLRLAAVREALTRHAAKAGAAPADEPAVESGDLAALTATMAQPPALEALVERFDLSPFERDLLVLCAGVELEADFAPLSAAAQGDAQRNYPTFSLALAALADAHWSALSPGAPLRYWNFIQVEAGRSLTRAALTIDERILHSLIGVNDLDKELAALLRVLPVDATLVPSHAALARNIAATWEQTHAGQRPTVFQLCGSEADGKRAIAAAACDFFEWTPYLLPAACLPTEPGELDRIRRLWQREAMLSDAVLVLDCESIEPNDQQRLAGIGRFLDDSVEPLILLNTHRLNCWQRPTITFDVEKPTGEEQLTLWEQRLGDSAAMLNGHLPQLVSQFHLTAPTIAAIVEDAAGSLDAEHSEIETPASPDVIGRTLWNVCRQQARPKLDDLAERIDAAAVWDDLILPDPRKDLLREISSHVRHRSQVYDRWAFKSKGNRGLGISALFAGASGTGKTMAAEVLAGELNLDLYRIDLSSVVSKYIGETEKNLRQVFDAAEAGGAILLFDEADALFGKRSEVKDSHDRHANIEVSYLLQRMETYRGLAILTTNLKDSLDQAFLRRIRFVVSFPFPDESDRAKIWQRIFPEQLPANGLDWQKLARLNISGGNIRNIALNAAFMAADNLETVQMKHILQAAQREYAKLERTLTAAEVKDWTDHGKTLRKSTPGMIARTKEVTR